MEGKSSNGGGAVLCEARFSSRTDRTRGFWSTRRLSQEEEEELAGAPYGL